MNQDEAVVRHDESVAVDAELLPWAPQEEWKKQSRIINLTLVADTRRSRLYAVGVVRTDDDRYRSRQPQFSHDISSLGWSRLFFRDSAPEDAPFIISPLPPPPTRALGHIVFDVSLLDIISISNEIAIVETRDRKLQN